VLPDHPGVLVPEPTGNLLNVMPSAQAVAGEAVPHLLELDLRVAGGHGCLEHSQPHLDRVVAIFTNVSDGLSLYIQRTMQQMPSKKAARITVPTRPDLKIQNRDPKSGNGKQEVLGLGFGMGALRFMQSLQADPKTARLFNDGLLSPTVCRAITDRFRQEFAGIPRLAGVLHAFGEAQPERTPISGETMGRAVALVRLLIEHAK
jgi:hypothetical protein